MSLMSSPSCLYRIGKGRQCMMNSVDTLRRRFGRSETNGTTTFRFFALRMVKSVKWTLHKNHGDHVTVTCPENFERNADGKLVRKQKDVCSFKLTFAETHHGNGDNYWHLRTKSVMVLRTTIDSSTHAVGRREFFPRVSSHTSRVFEACVTRESLRPGRNSSQK